MMIFHTLRLIDLCRDKFLGILLSNNNRSVGSRARLFPRSCDCAIVQFYAICSTAMPCEVTVAPRTYSLCLVFVGEIIAVPVFDELSERDNAKE